MTSRVYRVLVRHTRPGGLRYRFAYRLFNVCLALEELDRPGGPRLFSHNRPNLVSFYDRDHGPRDGTPPRAWLTALLARHDIMLGADDPIRVLCFPRVLGRGFNPLTLWYCQDPRGRLRAMVCEVHSTFGQSHCYVLAGPAGKALDLDAPPRKPKQLHVSPFFPMAGEYRFRFEAPTRNVAASVAYWQNGNLSLLAELYGEARPWSDRALLTEVLRMPWAGLKVLTAVHWQALKLWWRGAPFHAQPPIVSTARSS